MSPEVLKPRWPNLKVFAVEPTLSPVLSGGTHSPHPIQGIGAGFIPGVMRPELLDGILQVAPADAIEYARRAAREEGLLVGVSSGASLAAVAQLLPQVPDGVADPRLHLRHRASGTSRWTRSSGRRPLEAPGASPASAPGAARRDRPDLRRVPPANRAMAVRTRRRSIEAWGRRHGAG